MPLPRLFLLMVVAFGTVLDVTLRLMPSSKTVEAMMSSQNIRNSTATAKKPSSKKHSSKQPLSWTWLDTIDNDTALGTFLHLPANECPLSGTSTFKTPSKQLGDYTTPADSKVYLLGDSVLGQLCILGRPGLCCNSRVLCDNITLKDGRDPTNLGDYEEKLNATDYGSRDADWQHLSRFIARGQTHHPPVIQLAPQASHDDGGAALVEAFLQDHATESDILIAGLLGNHFQPGRFDVWETLCYHLIADTVNNFPGRVILLGGSPQHFRGDGNYHKDGVNIACGPFIPAMDSSIGAVQARQSLWDYSIYKYLDHEQTRVLDVSQVLSRFWMCHRYPTGIEGKQTADCTHWNDGVYSVITGMVLQALESLQKDMD